MASSDLTARLRYLKDAAHLLATTAPTTSRFLMSECNSLMFENGIEPSESNRREACGACGTIMILGWHGKLEVEYSRVLRAKGKRATERAKAMGYRCDSCGRQTRIELPAPSPRPKASNSSRMKLSSSIASNNTPLQPSASTQQTVPGISASSTGKKRTKAKKSSGLEAVLARQRAAESNRPSGFGLDLLDFMKKG
jgi:ribonuclease MRP protein subunit SNM1